MVPQKPARNQFETAPPLRLSPMCHSDLAAQIVARRASELARCGKVLKMKGATRTPPLGLPCKRACCSRSSRSQR
jgi:hypothetical protein